MVSVLPFNSDDASSNPAKANQNAYNERSVNLC